MTALALIALTGLGYAAHAAAHGDWLPLAVFGLCSAVYALVWTAELSLHRPAELRVERRWRSF